jgi:GNAT superfamily N-acetyltransferase
MTVDNPLARMSSYPHDEANFDVSTASASKCEPLLAETSTETGQGNVARVSELIDWLTPTPLEGVKSRKRVVLQVESTETLTSSGAFKVGDLALSLSSRILAVGDAGQVAANLLMHSEGFPVKRHQDLKVLYLEPSTFMDVDASLGYALAIASALKEQKPHIVLLSESEPSKDPAWQIVFDELVKGEDMWKFRGAVVICATKESSTLQKKCSERWVAQDGQIKQRRCLHVCENALLEGADRLIADAAQIPAEECYLKYWIDKAIAGNWSVARFDEGGVECPSGFQGLVFHHMIESSAELHIAFVFVPQKHRLFGIGGQMVQWLIQRASTMSQSDCRWISLETAHDELVPWYERLGFTDMSCGHVEGDYGQIRMEMPNVSVIS